MGGTGRRSWPSRRRWLVQPLSMFYVALCRIPINHTVTAMGRFLILAESRALRKQQTGIKLSCTELDINARQKQRNVQVSTWLNPQNTRTYCILTLYCKAQ